MRSVICGTLVVLGCLSAHAQTPNYTKLCAALSYIATISPVAPTTANNTPDYEPTEREKEIARQNEDTKAICNTVRVTAKCNDKVALGRIQKLAKLAETAENLNPALAELIEEQYQCSENSDAESCDYNSQGRRTFNIYSQVSAAEKENPELANIVYEQMLCLFRKI